jgi:phosphatidylglycerol:prolipoprotein diacylglycerol transferase
MHPVIFGFVKSYGLMLALSFLIGFYVCVRRGRARGLDADLVLDYCFAVMISSLVGVRLAFVVTHPDLFRPWYRIFYVWDGGLTLYGGIILATLTVWWLCRRRGVPFLTMADVMAPAVILGIGITRIGCFLSGCCYGQPTDSPLGVCFPPGSPAHDHFGEQCVQPTQLYSSAAGFAIFALLLWWERRPAPAGTTFARFLFLYGLARFGLDFLRYYEPEQVVALGLTNNQWVSLALVAGGIVLQRVLNSRETPGG